jgi:hypothetical protein
MNSTLVLILAIFASVCGLALMMYSFIRMDMHRKECKSCDKQGDEARYCIIEKGGCEK